MKQNQEGQSITGLEIKPQGLGACVAGSFLTVPKYQRAFSWDGDDVKNFYVDINSAFASGAPEYFMGSVVLQGSEETFEVVDGQQRLTSATLFIVAARDFLRSRGHDKVADSLETDFLLRRQRFSQEITPRLTLSVYDNAFFRNCILEGKDIAPKRESHERLLAARKTFREYIEGLPGSFNDWFERLEGLVRYLEMKTRVIQVTVPTQANAFVIFETLNDRGKDLSASDLLKNHLFGRSENRIEEAQASWNKMLGVVEPHGGDDLVITYIRQLWSATRELAREKELFSKIREKIVSPQLAVEFAAELAERAVPYTAILSPTHSLWDGLPKEASIIMSALEGLKIERYRPALLAVLVRFDAKELIPAMRFILNGSVRYLIAVGAGGGTLEAAWSEVACKVYSGAIKDAKSFAKEMQRIVPNDEVFRASFKSARVSKTYLSRYYLRALERFEMGEKDCELVPNADVNEVNLEHVLPENPGAGWGKLHPDIAEAFFRRLGNQAILSAKVNAAIGNDSFADKQKALTASKFKLTSEIAKEKNWGPDEIDKRQSKLADMAVKVWSYNP